jgi:hypothetical protein
MLKIQEIAMSLSTTSHTFANEAAEHATTLPETDLESELNVLVDRYLGMPGQDRRTVARILEEVAGAVRDEEGE